MKSKLKEKILELLEKDKEFRYAVAGYLGYDTTIKLLEEHSKRFEEHDKKFDVIVQELKELRKTTNELILILSEVSKILKEHSVILKEHTKYINDLRSAVGSLGRRMGLDLEKLIFSIYREQLKQIGIDEEKIRKFKYIDVEGRFGKKDRIYEFDILVSDDYVDVIEVKSSVSIDDVEWFEEKVERMTPLLKNVRRKIIVATNIDKEALELCNKIGIKVIYGVIVEE
ncbi:MAG: DUF3782 domain-containing protein [Thermoproteota archaeon]|jgi:hypothetical protein|nr:DUF3782 domain-containing protein [Thermoproteota archaeon]